MTLLLKVFLALFLCSHRLNPSNRLRPSLCRGEIPLPIDAHRDGQAAPFGSSLCPSAASSLESLLHPLITTHTTCSRRSAQAGEHGAGRGTRVSQVRGAHASRSCVATAAARSPPSACTVSLRCEGCRRGLLWPPAGSPGVHHRQGAAQRTANCQSSEQQQQPAQPAARCFFPTPPHSGEHERECAVTSGQGGHRSNGWSAAIAERCRGDGALASAASADALSALANSSTQGRAARPCPCAIAFLLLLSLGTAHHPAAASAATGRGTHQRMHALCRSLPPDSCGGMTSDALIMRNRPISPLRLLS